MGPPSCLGLPCLPWGLEGHLGPPEGRNRVGQPGISHYSEVHSGPFPQPHPLTPGQEEEGSLRGKRQEGQEVLTGVPGSPIPGGPGRPGGPGSPASPSGPTKPGSP